MTIKDKLEAYRRKKQKEEMTESIKNVVRNVFLWNRNNGIKTSVKESTTEEEVKLCAPSQNDVEDNIREPKSTLITKVVYVLYFLLWAILYVIALEYEFGAVYFVLSALVFICLNTRSGPKQQDEPSAYSVFNPNCEAIEGTLDASQFEREIRFGGIR